MFFQTPDAVEIRRVPGGRAIIGACLLVGVLLTRGACAGPESYYAGWAVGNAWNDGYGTILRSSDSGNTWSRQGVGQIADVSLGSVVAVNPTTAWVVGDPLPDMPPSITPATAVIHGHAWGRRP